MEKERNEGDGQEVGEDVMGGEGRKGEKVEGEKRKRRRRGGDRSHERSTASSSIMHR